MALCVCVFVCVWLKGNLSGRPVVWCVVCGDVVMW